MENEQLPYEPYERRQHERMSQQIAEIDKNIAVLAVQMGSISEKQKDISQFVKDLDEKMDKQISLLEEKMDKQKTDISKDILNLQLEQAKMKTTMRNWGCFIALISPILAELVAPLLKALTVLFQHPGVLK